MSLSFPRQVAIVSLTPERKWEAVGPVQVLTDGEETWVFYQFDTWKRRPGLLVSAPNVVIGWRQGVVMIGDGAAQVDPLGGKEGSPFHPNLSYIFHRDGHFYMHTSLGSGRRYAMDRWTGDNRPRFEPLDDAVVQEIAREEGLKDPFHHYWAWSNQLK
jgi:hypothetical protein